jgi:CO/xanthine dehydrogenase FAD-binding subunit
VLWTMRRAAMPSAPAVRARTRCTYLKRRHPATAEDRLVGSRLTPDAVEAAAHPANDGITFMGNAFGSATYLAELLPIYVSRAVSQIASPDATN